MKKKKSVVDKVLQGEESVDGESAMVKKIDQYEKSIPVQLELFQVNLPSERNRSNTVEFYDFVPKYVWGKVKRIDDMFLKTVKRDFDCRGASFTVRIHITDESGSTLFSDHLFETVGLQTREDWKGQGEKTKAFVRFNSLVTRSIKEGTYRQFNYEIAMSYRTVVARQLHKRMSHHFTQASVHIPYTILLSTVIRDFGLTQYAQARDNLRDVCVSLDEMVEKGVLLKYDVERINQKRKIVDAKLSLIPHPNFASEVMQANRKQKDRKLLRG
jgi:hypothetical protein